MKWYTDRALYDRCCGDRPVVFSSRAKWYFRRGPVYIASCGACGDEVMRSTPLATLTAWNKQKRKEAKA